MLGESVAYRTHATFVQVAGDGFTWTSNARFISKDKKESWPNTHRVSALAYRVLVTCLAKMPLLQLPNCQRSIGRRPSPSSGQTAVARAHAPTLPTNNAPIARLANGQRPTRQQKTFLARAASPASGHSQWLPTGGRPRTAGPFGGNAKYNGRRRPCQMPCNIDFTRVQFVGKTQLR
jgi:hypothetical protein